MTKAALNLKKLEIFSFLGSFWGPWGQPKKFRNLHKYKSHEPKFLLNSMGNTLKVKYKFGACQILKKRARFEYFPFPYEIWAENNERNGQQSELSDLEPVASKTTASS